MSKAQSETFLGAVAAKNAEACDINEWIEKWHSDQVELRGLAEYIVVRFNTPIVSSKTPLTKRNLYNRR